MVSGTKSAFKNMKLQVKELEVDGEPVTGATVDAENVTFSSPDFTATNVADALQELYDAANP